MSRKCFVEIDPSYCWSMVDPSYQGEEQATQEAEKREPLGESGIAQPQYRAGSMSLYGRAASTAVEVGLNS